MLLKKWYKTKNIIMIMIFIPFLLLLHFATSTYCELNYTSHRIRNTFFRALLLKEKGLPKILKKIDDITHNCYNKLLVSVSECMDNYNNLSYQDRALIESFIDLFF